MFQDLLKAPIRVYSGIVRRLPDPLTRYEAEFKARLLELSSQDHYLDVGGGDGFFTREVLAASESQPLQTVILDIDLQALEAAGVVGTERVVADVFQLPFRQAAFSKISAFQVCEHIEDVPGMLHSLASVASPGATFVAITPNKLVFDPDNTKFFPLLRNRLLQRLARGPAKHLLSGSRLSHGLEEGYKDWKDYVGHVRDGFRLADLPALTEGTGWYIDAMGEVGRTRLYYVYCDAFNFSFPRRWKLILWPLLPLITWAERRLDKTQGRLKGLPGLAALPGANIWVRWRRRED